MGPIELIWIGATAWLVISVLLIHRTGWILGCILSLSVGVIAAGMLMYIAMYALAGLYILLRR
jgi:hypothetical protein